MCLRAARVISEHKDSQRASAPRVPSSISCAASWGSSWQPHTQYSIVLLCKRTQHTLISSPSSVCASGFTYIRAFMRYCVDATTRHRCVAAASPQYSSHSTQFTVLTSQYSAHNTLLTILSSHYLAHSSQLTVLINSRYMYSFHST